MSGLELRIWKGKAIFKKGTLAKQEGTKAIQEKAQRPKKKIEKRAANSRGGGGGTPTHIFSELKPPPPKKKKKKKKKKARRQLSSAHSAPLNAKRIARPCAVICIGMKLHR